MKYPGLFSEIKIAGITLKNRIAMAPMFVGYAAPDGTGAQGSPANGAGNQ